jgi:hypothetical protein
MKLNNTKWWQQRWREGRNARVSSGRMKKLAKKKPLDSVASPPSSPSPVSPSPSFSSSSLLCSIVV